MYDYSRSGMSSRLAFEGELLVTRRLPTGLIGLISPFDMEDADQAGAGNPRGQTWIAAIRRWFKRSQAKRPIRVVYIPPGARLRMLHIPDDLRSRWRLRTVEDVWFTMVGEDSERVRDAIRFSNGRLIDLQSLPERICFIVVSLGSDDSPARVRLPAWSDDLPILPCLPAW
jgi:hypothetical protein